MKRKQVYILLGVALALAIVGTIFQIVRSSGWKGQSTDLEPFAKLPVNSIAKLVVKSSKGTVTLQKTNDIWTVTERNGYPADFSKIRDLIRSLWEFKVVRQLEVGPSQFGRLHILAPGQGDQSGIELDMIDANGNPVKTLIFGKAQAGQDEESEEGPNGRFVYDPSEKDKVYLGTETFFTVDASPQNWIDKDFIKPEAINEVTRSPGPDGLGWKISRKDQKSDWELADAKPGETLNNEVVDSLSSFSPSVDDVKPGDAPDSETGLKQPLKVDLTTFEGFKYNLEIGGSGPQQSHYLRFKVSADLPAARTANPKESADDKKKNDDEFNKQQDILKTKLATEEKLQKWVFEVPDDSLEALLKARKDILKAPVLPSPSPAANAGTPQKPLVPLPLAPVPNPTVSPAAPVASPSPEASPTPETTPTPEALPSGSPSPSASPGA
jgi:hypothetical protein